MRSNHEPGHGPWDDEDNPRSEMLIKTLRVDEVIFFREKTRKVKYLEIAYISNKCMFSPWLTDRPQQVLPLSPQIKDKAHTGLITLLFL